MTSVIGVVAYLVLAAVRSEGPIGPDVSLGLALGLVGLVAATSARGWSRICPRAPSGACSACSRS